MIIMNCGPYLTLLVETEVPYGQNTLLGQGGAWMKGKRRPGRR